MEFPSIDTNLYYCNKSLIDSGLDFWYINGTMLGLVRDGTLIPWDGDIDVVVDITCIDSSKLTSLHDNLLAYGFIGGINRRIRPGLPVLKYKLGNGRRVEISFFRRSPGDTKFLWYKTDSPQYKETLSWFPILCLKLFNLLGRLPDHELLLGRPKFSISSPFKRLVRDVICALGLNFQYKLQTFRNSTFLGEVMYLAYPSSSFSGFDIIQDKMNGVSCGSH